jgi:hypothetical protein
MFVRRHPWWTTGVGIVLLSAVLVKLARTSPGYDPYGWLAWGYQTLRFSLDLGGAPSWKPLPYLFTVPYALFGHYEYRLWMVTAVAISLAGCVFAGRIAYRLTDGDREHRYASIAAAVFAGAAVLGIQDYMHYVLSVQSDPMIVTFVLAAIDFHLTGRHRWAFWMLVLAALGRPEAWPFFGLYAVWLWWKFPKTRWMVAAGVLIVPFMWFGIPTITNGQPDIAGQLAKLSPRALKQNRLFGTLARFTVLFYLPVWIAALVCVALAWLRRNRLVLAMAAGCGLWVIIEIAFAFHGWPALPRYMFEPAAVAAVLAGVAVGWVLIDTSRMSSTAARWSGIALVAALVISLVPAAVARIRDERTDLHHERVRTNELNALRTTILALGGIQHIRNCGEPVSNVEFVSAFAWYMHLDVGFIGHRPDFELHQKYPIVLFTPLPNGWSVRPWHTRPYQVARCRGLHAKYVFTAHHPAGVLVRR